LSVLVDPRTKTTSRYTFQTVISDEFRYYGTLFYKKQKDQSWVKEVPSNIASLLTPRALAYWYMDDGALKWREIKCCSADSFTIDDINLLKVLETKFSLKVSLQKRILPKIMHFRRILLEIERSNCAIFNSCMYYKFPME
jgi:hypothetical protein